MIDIFLIVMITVVALVLIGISIFLLFYFGHPEDAKNGFAIFCKIVCVLGLAVAWSQVLLLPLDVSNARTGSSSIDMLLVWEIVYIAFFALLIIVIPFCIFFYESDEESTMCSRICWTMVYLFITMVFSIGLIMVTYAFLSKASVPVQAVSCNIIGSTATDAPISSEPSKSCVTFGQDFELNVSLPIYAIGLVSFVSWFLFVLFGGIGLVALPLDFIYDFITRPIKIPASELIAKKSSLLIETKNIKELGETAKLYEEKGAHKKTFFNSDKREYDSIMKRLRALVLIADTEYQIIQSQEEINDESVFKYYIGLVVGIFFALISLVWILQICLMFVFGQPLYPFLNNAFLSLTSHNLSFVAIGLYTFLNFYLMIATMKGAIKFGLRIVCCTVHPMKKHETYVNSFLFNVVLILISSIAIMQFNSAAFKQYIVMTDMDLIFSVQIKHLKFFKFFYDYNIFPYVLIGIIVLATIYLLCRPSDKQTRMEILLKRNEKEKGHTKMQEELVEK